MIELTKQNDFFEHPLEVLSLFFCRLVLTVVKNRRRCQRRRKKFHEKNSFFKIPTSDLCSLQSNCLKLFDRIISRDRTTAKSFGSSCKGVLIGMRHSGHEGTLKDVIQGKQKLGRS